MAKPHFGFGRMHVHIHFIWRQIEKKGDNRMAPEGYDIAICDPNRRSQDWVAYRPAIDDQRLAGSGCAGDGRRTNIAGQTHLITLRVQRQQRRCGVGTQQGGHAATAILGGQVEQQATITFQTKGDVGRGKGQAPHGGFCRIGFRPGRFEEFPAGRRGKKQVTHDDPRSRCPGAWCDGLYLATFDTDAGGAIGAPRTRCDLEPRRRPDTRQGLATKP